MSTKDASKLFIVTGGAIKAASSTAALPTGPNYVFDPAVWSDMGALTTQPNLTSSSSSETIPLWNLDDVTIPGTDTYGLTYGAGQLDYEVLKVQFNFDEVAADGSISPGDVAWSGQIVALLFTAQGVGMLHVPNALLTEKGGLDFAKKAATEVSFTFACNPDSRIGGKPWKLWTPTPLVAEGAATPQTTTTT